MTGLLIPTTSEADWLERRRQGVTASEIAVILGLSPYSSPFELYYRKRGELPGQPDNDAMAIGRAMENFVADQFGRRHPEFALMGSGRELYQHPEREWQMATPDRVVYEYRDVGANFRSEYAIRDPLAVLECKVDNGDGFGDEGSDDIPVHYRCQVLWQMDVLGVTTGYLAALIWHRRQVRVYEIGHGNCAAPPGSDDICLTCLDQLTMRGAAMLFLERIDRGDAPEPDWRPATTSALKHLHPLVEDRDALVSKRLAISYRAAVRHAKEADRRKTEMTNKLLEAMGNARRVLVDDGNNDVVLATRSVSEPERIDNALLRREYPDVARLVTKPPKPEIRLTPARGK